MSEARQTQIMKNQIDLITGAKNTIDYAHHETHAGSRFYVLYSVASLGAMTTPDDMITLTFVTPDTAKWGHFTFLCKGSSGWRIRLIEAPTGAAASPTGTLTIHNHNRNSLNTSTFKDLSGVAGLVSYDATLGTGGTTLWDEYITGSTVGASGDGATANRDELMLKQNTKYQVSIYGTDTEAATIYIDWYEHTNKD